MKVIDKLLLLQIYLKSSNKSLLLNLAAIFHISYSKKRFSNFKNPEIKLELLFNRKIVAIEVIEELVLFLEIKNRI